ncbi:hypothetical protein [Streptomyces spiramenti]|uniref:TlpA family protein disulfide reductase n=1 Tax=Streptomyces spiramenti TaxID=2720606 RepID=A0ABX1AJK7_9ACTN|nr:hypothetical protein [Streptomyces spiramenti]NJP65578.1 hypothetical protein [Streptomyces spiramenti]
MSGRSWGLVAAVVGTLLGLLLLAEGCGGRQDGGVPGEYFDARATLPD